jgi:hypothetical protein
VAGGPTLPPLPAVATTSSNYPPPPLPPLPTQHSCRHPRTHTVGWRGRASFDVRLMFLVFFLVFFPPLPEHKTHSHTASPPATPAPRSPRGPPPGVQKTTRCTKQTAGSLACFWRGMRQTGHLRRNRNPKPGGARSTQRTIQNNANFNTDARQNGADPCHRGALCFVGEFSVVESPLPPPAESKLPSIRRGTESQP